MLTSRYHIGSIIAIFVALGLGILLGGTLGQRWMWQTEQETLGILMEKYDRQVENAQALQQQLMSLQLMNKAVNPFLNNKKIWWIRPVAAENATFAMLMKVAGANLREIDYDRQTAFAPAKMLAKDGSPPDVIVVSDPAAAENLASGGGWLSLPAIAPYAKVIDVSKEEQRFNDPQEIVDFILYVKKILEEDEHAAVSFYRYSGME
ncbi:MAG TPA: copper transporter [Bacilli bacterium]